MINIEHAHVLFFCASYSTYLKKLSLRVTDVCQNENHMSCIRNEYTITKVSVSLITIEEEKKSGLGMRRSANIPFVSV